MLVFAKSPRGVLCLHGNTVYGCETGRDPVDLSFETYLQCRDALQDATYREGFLSQIFKKSFPAIAFTYHELRWLPEQTINTIGPLMVDDFDIEWSHKKKVDQIKIALREKSPCH